jgi:SprT-like family protein
VSTLPDQLPERLRLLGLRDVSRIHTHTNRTVMVSLASDGALRLHRGYAWASDRVLRAIVRFLDPQAPRRLRRSAQQELLAFPVEQYAPAPTRALRRERPRPGDLRLIDRLQRLHAELNARHFGGTLGALPIRLSGRMRTRLGELAVDLRSGRPLEIAISRRHLTRHDWAEVEHTMLHEMVHQWQAESGLRVDHGPTFRRKAREVGVLPAARRAVARRVD